MGFYFTGMKVLIFMTILSLSRGNLNFHDEWKLFTKVHGKVYKNPLEERTRMNIYLTNKEKIEKHNKDYEQGKITYKLAMNRYGDMLFHEFNSLMNGYKRNLTKHASSVVTYMPPSNIELPNSMDWREYGAVTPVKDQGHCGSCWSFSATGALEGQHFRKTGKLLSLSEQNLVDCSTPYGNNGCDGGIQELAFQYIKDNHGIDSENDYPYEAIDNACRYNPNLLVSSDKGYIDLPAGDEDALKAAIATVGPIAVSIDASSENFHFYKEGIYDEPSCSTTDLDHAVLAVGYGTTENGQDYWLVKNSWGPDWGENGYIKMVRNKNNRCGIASGGTYPLV